MAGRRQVMGRGAPEDLASDTENGYANGRARLALAGPPMDCEEDDARIDDEIMDIDSTRSASSLQSPITTLPKGRVHRNLASQPSRKVDAHTSREASGDASMFDRTPDAVSRLMRAAALHTRAAEHEYLSSRCDEDRAMEGEDGPAASGPGRPVPVPARTFHSALPVPVREGDVAVARALRDAVVDSRSGGAVRGRDAHAAPYLAQTQEDRQSVLAAQDEALDTLSLHVTRLGSLSLAIGDELGEQGRLVEDTGRAVEEAAVRVSDAEREVRRLIARSGGEGWASLLCAMLTVLLLLVWVAFGE